MRAALCACTLIGVGVAGRALLEPLATAFRPSEVEAWFFRPHETSPCLFLALGVWLTWRRWPRLAATSGRSPTATGSWMAVSASATTWAYLFGATELILIGLAAGLWAFASAAGGYRGWQITLWPGLVLLMGVPVPEPLYDEWVWWLQRWTARGSAWLLSRVGQPVELAGVLLRTSDHAFLVVEQCSGARGVSILMAVAIVVREWFGPSSRRQWATLALAPPLALLLNCVRVAYIAAQPNPEVALRDHTPQGVAILVAGTGLTYGAAALLALMPGGRPPPRGPETELPDRRWPWLSAAGASVVIAIVTLLVPSLEEPPRVVSGAFRTGAPGWSSEQTELEPRYHGVLPAPHAFASHCVREGAGRESVDLLVVQAVADNPDTLRLFSRKIELPDRDWEVERRLDARIWGVDASSRLHVALQPSTGRRAVVAVLRTGDLGLARESLRAWLHLDQSRFARTEPRFIARLTTPIASASTSAVDRGRRTLDRFAAEWKEALASLGERSSGSIGDHD